MTPKDVRKSAEREHVVKPLKKWLEKQNTKWDVRVPPNATETGWDVEARRKNRDLLIEAKYITRSFIGSFSPLVTSPLTNRYQHSMKKKLKSWCSCTCWAIGTNYKTRNIYQILFDYFGRNLEFWKHYGEDLDLYYVYFVKNKKVARIRYSKLLNIATVYSLQGAGETKTKQREIAEKLMSNLKYT
jgi:hypothetical protein